MKLLIVFISFLLLFPEKDLNCLNCSDDNKFSVLVITKTKGFVHKSIDAGINLIKLIGDSNKFNVYFSNTSDIITDENLENISSIIFLNTTGDILNSLQQEVMEDLLVAAFNSSGVNKLVAPNAPKPLAPSDNI